MSMFLASFETKKTVEAKITAGAGDSKGMKGEEAKTPIKGSKRRIDIAVLQARLTADTLTSLDLHNACTGEEAKPTLAATLSGGKDWVHCLTTLADGTLVSGAGDKMLRHRDIRTGRRLATLQGHKGAVNALVTLADGTVVSGSKDGTIKHWDMSTGQCLATVSAIMRPKYGFIGGVEHLAALADGTVVSSGLDDRTIKHWNVHTGQCLATIRLFFTSISAFATLADGTIISGIGGTIKHWNMDTGEGECLAPLTGHTDTINALTVLIDGTVVSGSADKTIKHWDLRTGRCLATITGHTGAVSALAALADGTVVSGSDDNTIKHWDLRTGRCLATLTGHTNKVTSFAVLADGTVVSGSLDTTLKHWTGLISTLHSLTTADVMLLLDGLFANRSVTYVNLQQAPLNEKAVSLLGRIISTHSTLQHIDLRQTGLSTEAVGSLYSAARQRAHIKLQHESMPYYQLDFSRYLQMVHEKPEDKEVHQRLLEISRTAHIAVLTQFNSILEHPEALTEKGLQEMFGNVCHVVDIKFPYTLLNMGMKANSFTSAQREYLKAIFIETLSHVAKLAVVDTQCLVTFKLVLKSALRKKLITYPQYLELDHEAEKCGTFADGRFKELRQQLIDVQTQLQAQINDICVKVADVKREVGEIKRAVSHLKIEVGQVKHEVSHLKAEVGQVKRDVGVLKENVHTLATDLNQLKTALRKKAERDVYFGVAKMALSFIGSGVVDLVQGACDLSDFEELSSTVFKLDPETKAFLAGKGENLHEFFKEHREMILDRFNEAAAKKLGLNPDEFIEKWSETGLLLQQLPLSATAEEKKAEESSHASAKPKTESKTEKSQSIPLSITSSVIEGAAEVQKFKAALARLMKHEDGNFTFQLKRVRFDCLQLQFTAADSILMSAEDIKKELIALAKSFKEAVASLDIKPAQYKTELNWKEWSFTITADTTVLTLIGGLLHQAGAAFFQTAPQARAVLFAPAAGKSQTSAQVESKDSQPAVACILQ